MRLADISTERLLQELAFRRDGAKQLRPVKRWCHDCVNWRYSKVGDMTDITVIDNCIKGHTMTFKVPAEHPDTSDDWGFYRRACRDWSPTPPPPEPPEPPRPPRSTPRGVA